jgi:YHS domain-containing protein
MKPNFKEKRIWEVKKRMAKDPVCGMNVNEKEAKYKIEHMGKTYYFCCNHCLETFRKDPHKYMQM